MDNTINRLTGQDYSLSQALAQVQASHEACVNNLKSQLALTTAKLTSKIQLLGAEVAGKNQELVQALLCAKLEAPSAVVEKKELEVALTKEDLEVGEAKEEETDFERVEELEPRVMELGGEEEEESSEGGHIWFDCESASFSSEFRIATLMNRCADRPSSPSPSALSIRTSLAEDRVKATIQRLGSTIKVLSEANALLRRENSKQQLSGSGRT